MRDHTPQMSPNACHLPRLTLPMIRRSMPNSQHSWSTSLRERGKLGILIPNPDIQWKMSKKSTVLLPTTTSIVPELYMTGMRELPHQPLPCREQYQDRMSSQNIPVIHRYQNFLSSYSLSSISYWGCIFIQFFGCHGPSYLES